MQRLSLIVLTAQSPRYRIISLRHFELTPIRTNYHFSACKISARRLVAITRYIEKEI